MKKVLLLFVLLVMSAVLCGCTITNGVFTGFSHHATDKEINASYASFNGSIAQRLPLKEGDQVTFSYTGDDGLKAAVMQNGSNLCDITDSVTYTVPADGTYYFSVKGEATDGAFSLSWQID